MIQKKFEEAITQTTKTFNVSTGINEFMKVVSIKDAAVACEPIHKEESIKFTQWIIDNYSEIYCPDLEKYFYVNHREHTVLINGNDNHYNKLSKRYGKTLDQLFDLFNEDKTIKL